MKFDVYPMASRAAVYAVDVQADFLSHLATRIIIPIVPELRLPERVQGLHPVIAIEGGKFVLVTQQLFSVQKRELRGPVASLAAYHDEITCALDILLTGF